MRTPLDPVAGAPDRGEGQLPQRRRRDPEASRAAILDAAREVFSERGYARATVREIASRAGVTHGLVMRHFGSKERLLIAAVPGPRGLGEVIRGDLETLPERIAATFVHDTESASGDHALITLIRSVGSGDDAAVSLYTELERDAAATYRKVLGDDADAQIDLLASFLIGVAFSRHVARVGALAQIGADELQAQLVPVIRAILAPALSPRPGASAAASR